LEGKEAEEEVLSGLTHGRGAGLSLINNSLGELGTTSAGLRHVR
jgi:hypothetical protein